MVLTSKINYRTHIGRGIIFLVKVKLETSVAKSMVYNIEIEKKNATNQRYLIVLFLGINYRK